MAALLKTAPESWALHSMILLKLISWPYIRKHLLRWMLTVTGIVLGVGAAISQFTNRLLARPLTLLEAGIKGNRVQRHLDVHGCRELGSHAAHALPRGSLALSAFPLDDQNVLAARGS